MQKQEQIYESANEVAKSNFKKLSNSMPVELSQKEAKIAKRLTKAKMPVLRKLNRLYELMDELSAHVDRFTPCSKGCNHCCTYPVTVSEIEIQNIENSTGYDLQDIKILTVTPNFSFCEQLARLHLDFIFLFNITN